LTETKRRCKIIFTSAEDVLALLEHAGLKPSNESPKPLSKFFKNKNYVELNCREGRPFEIVYSYTKELISISFYYGVWNAFGIPQHV
jgi:hypothetical protein